jgi:hypothetical protein
MHYVILRDDDTNALTPVSRLETLYRPFLDRGLPVNLAVIPEVRADAKASHGGREGFLPEADGRGGATIPLAESPDLVAYLRGNAGYHVVQHGCHHDPFEFDRDDRGEIVRRLERGTRALQEAGFPPSLAFVAPHDRLSRTSLEEVTRRYRVLSTGWFELGRLPRAWWPGYAVKKILRRRHWRAGEALLLSHPGCLLASNHAREGMLDSVRAAVESARLTVLVTHWWEYFQGGAPDRDFIGILHQTAAFLADRSDVKVISFDDLARHPITLD